MTETSRNRLNRIREAIITLKLEGKQLSKELGIKESEVLEFSKFHMIEQTKIRKLLKQRNIELRDKSDAALMESAERFKEENLSED